MKILYGKKLKRNLYLYTSKYKSFLIPAGRSSASTRLHDVTPQTRQGFPKLQEFGPQPSSSRNPGACEL